MPKIGWGILEHRSSVIDHGKAEGGSRETASPVRVDAGKTVWPTEQLAQCFSNIAVSVGDCLVLIVSVEIVFRAGIAVADAV